MTTEAGNLYVIAAPSGAGKTTLVKTLVDKLWHLTVSISHTTRPKRPHEIDRVNYHFIDQATFQTMVKAGEFLEHATIFGHSYGTSKTWVKDTLNQGLDVILEIDWQGHQQIKEIFPQTIGIFILPPSLAALKERLVKRNQDHPEVILERLDDAKEAISHIGEFDYIVLNDNFDGAVSDLTTIFSAGLLTSSKQQKKLKSLIDQFHQ